MATVSKQTGKVSAKSATSVIYRLFESLNEENLESVTYSLASSVFDSMDIKKVIFEVDDKIVDIKTRVN